MGSSFGALRAPIVDKGGNPSHDFLKVLQQWDAKLNRTITLLGQIAAATRIEGRTEGIGTTVTKLNSAGLLTSADQIAADGATYGRIKGTALTTGQVDLAKVGVIGPMGSTKLSQNIPQNYTNDATVDSIDAGADATARVYGPGGVGTNWTAYIGGVTSSKPSISLTGLAYTTIYFIYYTGVTLFSSLTVFPILPDGYLFVGVLTTIDPGGGGGSGGGGGGGGGGDGGPYKR